MTSLKRLNDELENSVDYNQLRSELSDTIVTNFFNLAYRFAYLGEAAYTRAQAINVAYNDSDLLDAYTQLAVNSTTNRARLDSDSVGAQIEVVKELLTMKANLSVENVEADSSRLNELKSKIDPMIAESINTNTEFIFQDYDDTNDNELDKRARFIDDFLAEKSFPIEVAN